jgi:SIR2-like domain
MRRELENVITTALDRAMPGDISVVLERLRDGMLTSLFKLLRVDANRVEYLEPLIAFAHDQRSLTVGTLNYDRSVEEAAAGQGMPCDTGIATWLASGQLSWSKAGIRLLKLHGSIDWVLEDTFEQGRLPRKRIRVVSLNEVGHRASPAVVFGEAGKLRSEGPFLELLLSWLNDLRTARTLLVVGYSFRDAHVNETIARWFNDDDERRVIVVDPQDLATGPYDSFRRSLVDAKQVFTEGAVKETGRVVHLQGTAAQMLEQAIEIVGSELRAA